MFDFNKDNFNLGDDIETTLFGKSLILKSIQQNDGPVTLQYLPYGGIQSVFGYNLIINTRQGFIIPSYVIYDGVEYKTRDFVIKFKNLINLVLPN